MSGPDKPHRGRRILDPEERALWRRVVSSAKPLKEKPLSGHVAVSANLPAIPDAVAPDAPRSILPPLGSTILGPRHGKTRTSLTLLSPEVEPVGRPQAGLDKRTANKLRKGERNPDSRIDLHGMTAERAHRVLLTFLSGALSRGNRVVLVITGKGRARTDDIMSSGRGILRESLPGWLRASPIGHAIVGIYRAHQKHGGDGAFYVYLKRNR